MGRTSARSGAVLPCSAGRRARLGRLAFCAVVGALATLVAVPAQAAPRANKDCGAANPNAHPLTQKPWPLRRLAPANVWGFSRGQGVTVAVIDSGVSPDHPKLGNGKVLPGFDFIDNGPDGTCDDHGHGTFVAGIIAGWESRNDSDSPFTGVAPDARILPIKAMKGEEHLSVEEGRKRADLVAGAVDYAVAHKAQVINMSLVLDNTPALAAAIDRALKANVVVVAAAGNTGDSPDDAGKDLYPAAYEGVLAVGGVDETDKHASSSTPGRYVRIAAPGVNVDGPTLHGGGYVTEAKGTSYAAAYVSGIVALLRGYYKDLTAAQIVDRITKTADRPPLGKDDQVGFGIINPYRAMTALLDPAAEQAKPVAGGLVRPAAHDDPLYAAKTYGPWLAGSLLGVTALLAVLGFAFPRGSRRGWRPGRAVRAPDPTAATED
ncbi:type VII secretion-associated serine protease mycosin [Longispora sp. K20-0274]|uniref:type VII secretion-associated serine protease mycosin n=1 Tax=Longispora sp. K20-0274 TaxID=3088255 RepID=UPI00399A9C16